MANDKKIHDEDKPMSFITLVVLTGLIGGILWSSLAFLAYYLNLTSIHPRVILEPWAIGMWKKSWLGTVMSIGVYGIVSIGVAFVYYGLLRKLSSIFVGIGFGILLFLIVFLILNPIFPGLKPILELDRETLITTVCFYILYGVFIGYSISYEQQQEEFRRDKNIKV